MTRPVVMHLITGLNTGGAEMMVYKTCKQQLETDNFTPIVVSLLPKRKVGQLIEGLGVKVYYLNFKKKYLSLAPSLFKLINIFHKEKPTILNSYMFHADIIGRIIGYLCRIPVIVSSIRNENIGGRKRELALKYTDFMVDKVTSVSEVAGIKQIDKGTVKTEKLMVIHNGVDISLIDKEIKSTNKFELLNQLKIPTNNRIIITVGRLEEQKDHRLLFESFARFLKIEKNTTLLVVGDRYLMKDLESLSTSLGIEQNVIFTGIRKDIPSLLSIADLFVLSSSWEGLPNVVLEAMAAKKPVIATNVGGIPEIVKHNKNGFIVEPGNVNELYLALYEMFELSEDALRDFGLKGREIIEKNFTIKQNINKLESLYFKLLKENRKR